MTKRGSRSRAAGLEVVEGEGGEPLPPSGGDTSVTYDVSSSATDYDYGSSDAGSTTGVSTLQLEIDILSAAAVDRVAKEIARRVASRAAGGKITSVTVASPAVLKFLQLHSGLEAEVASLEAIADKFAAEKPEAEGDIEVADTTAFILPALPLITAAARAAPNLVNQASSVLRKMAATTAYSGRSDRARQVLLDAALAKHLSAGELDVSLPERSPPSTEPRGLMGRILKLQGRCRELQSNYKGAGDIGSLLTPVDALVAALFGTADERATGVPLAQQVMLADGIARRMGKEHALLVAEIVFSGGSYRTRKWLFNFLFGKDGLTYSGGAGVTYFLFRGSDRATLDSDTIYFASPHGSFDSASSGRMRATNIGAEKRP